VLLSLEISSDFRSSSFPIRNALLGTQRRPSTRLKVRPGAGENLKARNLLTEGESPGSGSSSGILRRGRRGGLRRRLCALGDVIAKPMEKAAKAFDSRLRLASTRSDAAPHS